MGKPTLRSDFLIHWIGKKSIEDKHPNCEAHRQKAYLDALRETLINLNGFRMMPLCKTFEHEPLLRELNALGTFNMRMKCFSEIKLSQVREHTERYGRLGFGFRRSFVINNKGAPVFYVPATDHNITRHFFRQFTQILFLCQSHEATHSIRKSGAIQHMSKWYKSNPKIQKIIRSLGFDHNYVDNLTTRLKKCQTGEECQELFLSLTQSMATTLAFVKIIEGDSKYEFLDEAEWRVVLLADDKNKILNFKQQDLKVLIFPDPKTREMALWDPDIRKWLFKVPPNFPVIATVEDCLHF